LPIGQSELPASLKAGNLFSVKQMTDNPAAYSKQFRRQMQRLLSEAGVYDGAIDGRFGPDTKTAIEKLAKRAQTAR
jgi:peptidoglycan hydrolase-like protein with peptidoglycan-binding domain